MNHKIFLSIFSLLFGFVLVACQPLSGPGAGEPPADWLTYTHPKAGFSFAYPPEAKFYPSAVPADSPDYGYSFMDIGLDKIYVFVMPNPAQMSVDEYLISPQANVFYSEQWPPENYKDYITSFQVDGHEARQVEQNPAQVGRKYSVFIVADNLFVVLALGSGTRDPEREPSVENIEIYQQVVASVRFSK